MKVCISDPISPQGAAGRKIAFDNVHAEHPKAQAGDNNSTAALLALNDDTVLGVNRDSQLTYRGGDQQCAAIPRAQLSSGPEWRRSNRSAAASIVGIPNGHTAGAECTRLTMPMVMRSSPSRRISLSRSRTSPHKYSSNISATFISFDFDDIWPSRPEWPQGASRAALTRKRARDAPVP